MANYERAERELSRGKLWRAKEILQGALPNAGYDAELFERYGVVLLKMGDLPEAGKYLFWSGARTQEYEEAINLFLRRHGRQEPKTFLRTLPHKARLSKLADYPDAVANALRELGWSESLPWTVTRRSTPSEKAGSVLFVATILAILALMGLLLSLGVLKAIELTHR